MHLGALESSQLNIAAPLSGPSFVFLGKAAGIAPQKPLLGDGP